MAKQTFTTGQVLTAAEMTSLQATALGGGATTAKTVSYVLLAADAGTVVQMNSATATTITVNTALFAAGDTVQIQNAGAGVLTVTAGTATVSTSATLALKQYDAGTLYFNTTSAAFFFAVDAADSTSPLTTKGDLYGYSTLDARIPIGTNNQVLTADSAQALGLKWATPSATTPVNVGVSLYKSANQTLANNTLTILTWDSEVFDTDALHASGATDNRITIPTGKGGKYLFCWNVAYSANATGERSNYFYKNAVLTNYQGGFAPTASSEQSLCATYIDSAIAGDYYYLSGEQTSGGNLDVRSGSIRSFFSATYLGS